MYVPPSFSEEDLGALHAVIREHSFATLVSRGGEGPFASHLPFLLDAEAGRCGTLRGHMARANRQWRDFEAGVEVLVVFQGPHAYISPSWYRTELSVPTWNYVAVHAYGKPRLIEGESAAVELLREMVATYEGSLPQPWSMDRLPADFVDKLVTAIVPFEMEIERLEGKFKLGQNRSDEDRRGVAAALGALNDPAAVAVAGLMERGIL